MGRDGAGGDEVGRGGMGVIYTVVKLSTYEVAKGHKSWL